MSFCPSCRAEYEAGITQCPDCDTALVNSLPVGQTDDMVNVYVCYNKLQTTRLADILHDDGLYVLVRDRRSSAFPTDIGETAQQIIAVPSPQTDRARELIGNAIEDEVVPDDGKMLES